MQNPTDQKIVFKKSWREGDPLILIEFLEKYSKLSKSVLKKVLNNGSVWLRLEGKSKLKCNRRATQALTKESLIEFYYDPKLMNLDLPPAKILFDQREWGLWYKPTGMLSQGNEFGDHGSILRLVEKTKNKAWLIHRLDREASGVMLFAYTIKAARLFSELWQKHKVRKFYKIEVLGVIENKSGEINLPLDGKEARSTYEVLETTAHTSKVLVEIHTGRLHQIRRHFEMIGHPVLGDPKYGVGNKNEEGMKLVAVKLQFIDPFTQKEINYCLPE